MSYMGSEAALNVVIVGLNKLESRVVFSADPWMPYVGQSYKLEATTYVWAESQWVPLGGAAVRFMVKLDGTMYEVTTRITNSSGYTYVIQDQNSPMTLWYAATLLEGDTYYGDSDGGYVEIIPRPDGEEPPDGEIPQSVIPVILLALGGLYMLLRGGEAG